MSKRTINELDNGQLDMMWKFLRLKKSSDSKPEDVKVLKGYLDKIRQALIQMDGGQRKDAPKEYVDFGDLGTYINLVVIQALTLYIDGGLDLLEKALQDGSPKIAAADTVSKEKFFESHLTSPNDWTEDHVDELFEEYYVIPKQDSAE